MVNIYVFCFVLRNAHDLMFYIFICCFCLTTRSKQHRGGLFRYAAYQSLTP